MLELLPVTYPQGSTVRAFMNVVGQKVPGPIVASRQPIVYPEDWQLRAHSPELVTLDGSSLVDLQFINWGSSDEVSESGWPARLIAPLFRHDELQRVCIQPVSRSSKFLALDLSMRPDQEVTLGFHREIEGMLEKAIYMADPGLS